MPLIFSVSHILGYIYISDIYIYIERERERCVYERE